MAPLKYGKLIPEIYHTTLLSNKFCIVIDIDFNADSSEQLASLCTLRDYLRESNNTSIELSILLSSRSIRQVPGYFNVLEVPLIDKSADFQSQLDKIVRSTDADVLVTDSDPALFSNSEGEINRFVTKKLQNALVSAEIFVRGHEIPWSFSNPAWKMPWTVFHTMSDSFAKQAGELYYKHITNDKLSQTGKEVLRSFLLNKISYISYTKDKLLFYIQQRSYAKRNGYIKQDFKFELGYFLTYYYLLYWGGIEQLSFLINDILELGFEGLGTSITSDKFRSHIFSKNKEVGNTLIKPKNLEWFDKLRRIRHFAAHQGNVTVSDLMTDPDKEVTPEEIEKEVENHPYLTSMSTFFSGETLKAIKNMLTEQVKVSKYKKIADDATIVFENGKKYLYFPLRDVELDFATFKNLIIEVLIHFEKK